MDSAIASDMFVESIIIAFSIREDMYFPVALGALVIIGLKATKKVLNDWNICRVWRYWCYRLFIYYNDNEFKKIDTNKPGALATE